MSDIAVLLPYYVLVAVLLVAALWAYRTFLRDPRGEPAMGIDVDLEFVGVQADKHIVQVTASVENRGLVRYRFRDVTVTIRYLTTEDEVADGAAGTNYQLNCPQTIDSRIGGQKRLFADAGCLNPKQRLRLTYVTYLPSDASFALVQCKFAHVSTGIRTRWAATYHAEPVVADSQRIYRVPSCCAHPCRGGLGVLS